MDRTNDPVHSQHVQSIIFFYASKKERKKILSIYQVLIKLLQILIDVDRYR